MINNLADFKAATAEKVIIYNKAKKVEITFEKCRTLITYNVGDKITLAISPEEAYILFEFYKTLGFDVV